MLVLIGYVIGQAGVFGGCLLAGGHIAALLQPVELLMIGGGAVGALVVGNSGKSLKALAGALPPAFKSSKYNKALYMELMSLLYELLQKMRKEGLMSIERDVETPAESRSEE